MNIYFLFICQKKKKGKFFFLVYSSDVIERVNSQISNASTGRLFAVVFICGKQFKVTENDIIIIQGHWPPNAGDKLTLEKVLLVGSSDFTLIGRPLLNREQVSVDVTVIEKSLSHTKTHFKKKRRKQYMRINCEFYILPRILFLILSYLLQYIFFFSVFRTELTMLRINSININGRLNEKKDFEGLDRIF